MIAVGVVFLVGRLNGGLDWSIQRLWPVLPLVMGLSKLIVPAEDGSRRGGVWLTLVGIVFLLHNYQIMLIDDSWPLFIVGLGVSILLGRGKRPRPAQSGS